MQLLKRFHPHIEYLKIKTYPPPNFFLKLIYLTHPLLDHNDRFNIHSCQFQLFVLALAAIAAATSEAEAEPSYGYGYGIGYGRSYGGIGYGRSYGGYGGYLGGYRSYGDYYGKREAEPTAVAEAEADPYYGSYGYGGLSYGSYGRSYGGYGLSYGRSYGGCGLSYGGYGRSYYFKREADAAPEGDPTFRKNRKRRLLTDIAMATATEAMATPPEATADPIQSPVATDPTAAMALLTAATTTESRQHQRNNLILINMNWTKLKCEVFVSSLLLHNSIVYV